MKSQRKAIYCDNIHAHLGEFYLVLRKSSIEWLWWAILQIKEKFYHEKRCLGMETEFLQKYSGSLDMTYTSFYFIFRFVVNLRVMRVPDSFFYPGWIGCCFNLTNCQFRAIIYCVWQPHLSKAAAAVLFFVQVSYL